MAINPDVVHLIGVRPSVVLSAAVAARIRGASIVYEATDIEPSIAHDGTVARLARTVIDRAIAPSNVVETALLEAGMAIDIDVIGDPIDFDRLRGTVPREDADIVWVDRSGRGEDLDVVLLGLAELRDRDWRAVLFTDEEAATIYDTASDMRLGDRIDVRRPGVDRGRMAVYRGASAFVQTAAVCAYPAELLVGMAAGCVGVVQYQERSSGHELIETYRTGELISTPVELADAIVAAADRESTSIDDRFARQDIGPTTDRILRTYERAITGSD